MVISHFKIYIGKILLLLSFITIIFKNSIFFKPLPHQGIYLLFVNFLLIYFIIIYKYENFKFKNIILKLLILSFIIINIISLWINDFITINLVTFEIFNLFLMLYVFLIILPEVFSKKDYYDIIALLIYISLVISILGCFFRIINVDKIFNVQLAKDVKGSISIPDIYFIFGHRNQFGTFLMLFPALSLLIYFIKKKNLFILYSTIIFISIILSFSRSSYLMMFISLIPFFYLFIKYVIKKINIKHILLILVIMIIAIILFIDFSYFLEIFRLNKGVSERDKLWVKTIEIIGSNFLYLGKGYGNFRIYNKSPHNAYLMNFAHNGLIGLMFFLSIIIYILIKTINRENIKKFNFIVLLFIIAGILIQQNFESQIGITFYYINYLFYFLLGFLRVFNKQIK